MRIFYRDAIITVGHRRRSSPQYIVRLNIKCKTLFIRKRHIKSATILLNKKFTRLTGDRYYTFLNCNDITYIKAILVGATMANVLRRIKEVNEATKQSLSE